MPGRLTVSVPKETARFLRREARFREVPRDVLVAWLFEEAARQDEAGEVEFDFSEPAEERLGQITRCTMDVTREGLRWVLQQTAAERCDRNQIIQAVIREGHEYLTNRRPSKIGFAPSERRLYEIDRAMNRSDGDSGDRP